MEQQDREKSYDLAVSRVNIAAKEFEDSILALAEFINDANVSVYKVVSAHAAIELKLYDFLAGTTELLHDLSPFRSKGEDTNGYKEND